MYLKKITLIYVQWKIFKSGKQTWPGKKTPHKWPVLKQNVIVEVDYTNNNNTIKTLEHVCSQN